MPGGTMKTQNGQWGQSNYEDSKFYIIYKPMLLRETYIFFSVYTDKHHYDSKLLSTNAKIFPIYNSQATYINGMKWYFFFKLVLTYCGKKLF